MNKEEKHNEKENIRFKSDERHTDEYSEKSHDGDSHAVRKVPRTNGDESHTDEKDTHTTAFHINRAHPMMIKYYEDRVRELRRDDPENIPEIEFNKERIAAIMNAAECRRA